MTAPRPFLPITLGDPAGIGPKTAALAALTPALRRRCRPLLIGDARALARVTPPEQPIRVLNTPSSYGDRPGVLNILHIPHPSLERLRPGHPSRLGGESAVAALTAAIDMIRRGDAGAVVTGPVSKESLHMARIPHPGYTEILQAMSRAPRVEMLMTAGPFRALLITRHIPLKDVPARLTSRGIVDAVNTADACVARLAGRRPRWAMAGLNPHAGDNGLLGVEEKRVVAPAVASLKKKGVLIDGPWPADVAWARHVEDQADAVACLYHDQGMIPLKTLHSKKVVNITAGLPFVRTSPGHGTAFDLAPRYLNADPTPTLEACHRALDLL